MARIEIERIKYTSHYDGLGMGDHRAELGVGIIAAALERMGEE